MCNIHSVWFVNVYVKNLVFNLLLHVTLWQEFFIIQTQLKAKLPHAPGPW